MKVHELETFVANKIIDLMQTEGIRWVQPWVSSAPPCNGVTGYRYGGGNTLTTAVAMMSLGTKDPRFIPRGLAFGLGTQERIGTVRKGEKGTPIMFFGKAREEDENGEEGHYRFARVTYAWHVSQFDEIDEDRLIELPKPPENPGERCAKADLFLEATRAVIEHNSSEAFYSPQLDRINLPPIGAFRDTQHRTAGEGFYAIAMHELTHWTGHKNRLDRKIDNRFGSQDYAFEELIAEIGSCMLCMNLGLVPEPDENNAAYIKSWIEKLKSDPGMIFRAASKATEAARFLESFQQQKDQAA